MNRGAASADTTSIWSANADQQRSRTNCSGGFRLSHALGARAVVIGRLAAAGLAAASEEGVARVLDLLRQEMMSVLTLLGRGSVTDLTTDALQTRQP
jgi:isopentenyl diphosphate isomerase/L-lactate dehydrogenase-like FMN-dependent dehydrogenase